MSTTTTKYGVLVCIDGSAASDAAIVWGAREAAMRHMPITLLHAVAPGGCRLAGRPTVYGDARLAERRGTDHR